MSRQRIERSLGVAEETVRRQWGATFDVCRLIFRDGSANLKRVYSFRIMPVAALLLSGTVSAAIIDDFSTDQGPLVLTGGAASGPGIIGGVREFFSGHTFQAAGGVGTFSTPNGSSNVSVMYYDGLGDGAAFNSTFAPVDLTDGGVADLFIVSVTELFSAGVLPPSASLALNLVDADSNSASTSSLFALSAPGVFSVALPASGIDLTRITALSIPVFLSTSPLGEFSFGVDYFCTGNSSGCTSSPDAVPEPGTLGLLGLGLAALAVRRRKP